MAVHLLRVAVGVESIEHLREIQALRLGEGGELFSYTRHIPRRAAALIDGGSIYWIVKRAIRVRQSLLAVEEAAGPNGKRCALRIDPTLVATEPVPRRPRQGWRYLEDAEAPADLDLVRGAGSEMPETMIAELRELGLL